MFSSSSSTSSPDKIKEFKAEEYYSRMDTYREEKLGSPLKSISLRPMGAELVAQYYREKYRADIVIYEDTDKLSEFLTSTKISKNTRKAFVLISGDERPHAIPIIYINENGEEGLLFANSLGTTDTHAKYWAKNFKKPFYFVSHIRQSDYISCHIDALTFSRDSTALDEKTSEYTLPNLLTQLKSRCEKIEDDLYRVRLPDELLKTAQIPEFVESHKEPSERKVYKDETITLFRGRYTDKGNFVIPSGKKGDIKKENPPNYLRKKGLKLANIIEIQFYINELKAHLGSSWTATLRQQFIREAKTAFAAQSNIYTFAQSFLMKAKTAGKSVSANLTPPLRLNR